MINLSNDKNESKVPLIITILVILFFIYLFTRPKGHWLIGVWNWFMSGPY